MRMRDNENRTETKRDEVIPPCPRCKELEASLSKALRSLDRHCAMYSIKDAIGLRDVTKCTSIDTILDMIKADPGIGKYVDWEMLGRAPFVAPEKLRGRI